MSIWNVVELYKFIDKPVRKKNFGEVYLTCKQIEIENNYAFITVDMGIRYAITSISELEIKPEEKEEKFKAVQFVGDLSFDKIDPTKKPIIIDGGV